MEAVDEVGREAPTQKHPYQVGSRFLSADEMVQASLTSSDTFFQLFFPKTVRQPSSEFHLRLDSFMENPTCRFVGAEMFRGSAKTTRLRMHTGRRVAYGLSKTILYVGASEGHASRSVKWLRRQVEVNKTYSSVFGLRPGAKWQESELEILNTITGDTCWILGVGITGNVRGINFDDYRPDFIVLDDVITDENAATLDQRSKTNDLILGAIKGSLAPETEDPNAKMVFLQTPLHLQDAAQKAKGSSQWNFLTVPIWTDETLDEAIENQVSRWPERYPSETVQADKRAAAESLELSTWTREYEVRLISAESRAFRQNWITPLDIMPSTYNVLSIDPLPPPSEREVAQGFKKKDFEALAVVGFRESNYYLQAFEQNRGHEPTWTIAKVFELAREYQVSKIVVEGVAYQKTLKWILEQEMKRRATWYQIELAKGPDGKADRRPKYHRIVSTLAGLGQAGRLFCRREHTDFIVQFSDYPRVDHDDLLEAFAQGVASLVNPVFEAGGDEEYIAKLVGHSMSKSKRSGFRLRGAP